MNNRCSTPAIYAMRQIIVAKKTYLLQDEFHVEKFRRQQFTIDFTFPADAISYSDTMNVIPFEGTPEEIIRRGLQLKYIPNQIS